MDGWMKGVEVGLGAGRCLGWGTFGMSPWKERKERKKGKRKGNGQLGTGVNDSTPGL